MTTTKPPNILVYSEAAPIRQELITTLRSTLAPDSYTVYPVTRDQVEANAWPDCTVLLVVHGPVESVLAEAFIEYFLNGGKMLSICSDLLGLPSCKEVQGTEQVTLSYENWDRIRVTQEMWSLNQSEERFVEHLHDHLRYQHEVNVRVLAVEESFRTPSILVAESNGKAVLTQIVLTDLEQDGQLKIDLLKHFLDALLEIRVRKSEDFDILEYTSAFLLGTDDDKVKLVNSLTSPNQLSANNLTLQFQPTPENAPTPSATFLPVLTTTLPDNFNYSEYQRYLATTHLGRPLIYAPVMTTTMAVINRTTLPHGFAVIARRLTNGCGRANNQWLSPEGCAMFSMQLHVPLDSHLGQRLPMVQHLVGIGVVSAIRSISGYENLDIGLKWPNDIYAGGRIKIGGIVVNSQLQGTRAVVNVGCGINLSNSSPTTCVNDLVREFGGGLPEIGYERMLALVFNEIERLLELVQKEGLEILYELYYKYWLHGGNRVMTKDDEGLEICGKIVGIDEYGYLMVEPDGGGKPIRVLPDGNSFDMMKGLIVPKYC